MPSPLQPFTVRFAADELELLDRAAKQCRMRTADYIRNVAVGAAKTLKPAAYTSAQLPRIHRQGPMSGGEWTEAELRERGLPLYWSRAWLEAQLASGETYTSLAVQHGWNRGSISDHALRTHGIRHHRTLTADDDQIAEAILDAGGTLVDAARAIDVAPSTVSLRHPDKGRPGRVSRERLAAITWPATVNDVTALLGGEAWQARSWLQNMIRDGKLVRLARGVYTTPDGPVDIPPGMRARTPTPRPSRYANVDWSRTNRAIAKDLGVTGSAVGIARKRLGAPRAKRGWRVRRSDVAALLDAGLTVAEAAVRLGLPPDEVRAHLKRIRRDRGLPTSSRQMRPYVDAQVGRDYIAQLVALAQAGEPWPTVKATAIATGASEASVSNWRKRARERLAQLGGPDPILPARASREGAPAPGESPTLLPRSGLSHAERQRIWDAVDWSLRDVDIARQLGVNPSAVGARRRRGRETRDETA